MRAAAAVLLTASSVCLGLCLRDGLRRRVRLWTQVCLFLREVRLRAQLHEPLDVQIAVLSQSSELSELTLLADCAERCRQGQPLPQAWTLAVEAFARKQGLPHAQREMFAGWIPTLSAADAQRVEGLLRLYEARAAQLLKKAAQQESAVGSLCVRVCAAVGLLLGILIL